MGPLGWLRRKASEYLNEERPRVVKPILALRPEYQIGPIALNVVLVYSGWIRRLQCWWALRRAERVLNKAKKALKKALRKLP